MHYSYSDFVLEECMNVKWHFICDLNLKMNKIVELIILIYSIIFECTP